MFPTIKKTIFAIGVVASGFVCSFSAIAADYKAPRNSFGQPDLQGIWTNATMSTLERPAQYGNRLVLSEEEGQRLENNNVFNRMKQADLRPTDPNAPAPRAGAGVGGYNAFWMDPGERLLKVNGEYRTSIIVSPQDGKIPYSAAGKKAHADGVAQRSNFDGPEVRPLGERCLVGFGATSGPPMLPVLYNNFYQIVQGPDAVVILVEMNHDARIVRLNAKHSVQKKWLGDSVGYWEGDTLVVETINMHPQQTMHAGTNHRIYVPETAKVIERFTRVSEHELVYQFTVEDATAYTQPWRGEMPFHAVNDKMFEYACHEGNYSLPGILAGAREDEKAGRKPTMGSDRE